MANETGRIFHALAKVLCKAISLSENTTTLVASEFMSAAKRLTSEMPKHCFCVNDTTNYAGK